MPVGDAQPDDGVLDILLVPKVSRITFFRLLGRYSTGRYRECAQVIRDFHCRSISFSSQEEMVGVVDGEVMRAKEFTVCLAEKKINFFYPADVFWRESLQTANNLEMAISEK